MNRTLLLFGFLFGLSIFLRAQHYFPIQPDKNKLQSDTLESENPLIHRSAIQLVQSNSTGEWVTFKNWNEGNSVVAENDSIVWVGTAVGLVRWNVNSKTYQMYDETNGLIYSSINCLALDHKHQLWIGTTQGLVKYVNGTFTFYNHLNSPLPDAAITKIVIDSSDRIYAGTEAYVESNAWKNGGFVIYDGTTWKSVTMPIDGWIGPLWSLACYHDTIYVSCGYTQTYIYTVKGLEKSPGWSFGGATSFAIDYQDNLWAESNQMKMLMYSGGRWTVVIDNQKEGIGQLWSELWNDPRGGLWLSNSEGWYVPNQVLYRLDIEKRRRGETCTSWLPKGICEVPELTKQFNSQYAIDSNHQYFATRWGLLWFNGSTWQSIQTPKTLLSNVIYSLGTSPTGEVYLSAEMAIEKTDGIKWDSLGGTGWIDPEIKFKPDGSFWRDGIHGQYATGLDYDGYDALWAAYGTIMTQNSTGFKQWLPKDIGIQRQYGPQFMDIAIDKHERIWATGWYNGTVMYDRTNWHVYYSSDTTLPNNNYDRIYADSEDRIWFATNQWSPNYGFTIFDGKQWKTYYSPQRYSISYVYQLAEDNFGNVWLATGGGLLKYDGSSFTIFDNSNSPLRTNKVYAVTVDLANNIWIGTTSGLYVYNPSGVRLGTYTYSSPVDSFSITNSGKFARARFLPNSISSSKAKYELQRGRSKRKFWTVAKTDFLQNCCSTVELRDTSAIIGDYYYRIKKIDSYGNTSYSQALSFAGGKIQAHLLDSKWYFSGNHLILTWKTEDESFITGYEIQRNDLSSNQSILIAYISSNSPKSADGYYVLEVDTLHNSSKDFDYTLFAVFADSSRLVIQKYTIAPLLPVSFSVTNNFPNPFNSTTMLEVHLPVPAKVVVRVFDLLGREVLPVFTKVFKEGYNRIQLDFRTMASGVYIYRVESNGKSFAGKLVLLK